MEAESNLKLVFATGKRGEYLAGVGVILSDREGKRPALKFTAGGPICLVQVDVMAAPAGSPSSVTVPLSATGFGSVTLRSGPAFSRGARFVGSTRKPAEDEATCNPVRKATGRGPAAALPAITIRAVAAVRLVIVSDETVMPSPKLATVLPVMKSV